MSAGLSWWIQYMIFIKGCTAKNFANYVLFSGELDVD